MEIPQDIAFEILSWLPAKSIFKLQPTCESFSNFPKEKSFTTKQANNLLGRNDTCFFIQPDQLKQRYEKRIEFHSFEQSSGVPNNVLQFLSNSSCVLASSNGLVLCYTINNHHSIELFICNPITKSRYFIPTPESLQRNGNYAKINLMLDCSCGSSDDFSVFLFEYPAEWMPPTSYTVKVYNGKVGEWKTMENNFFPGGRNMRFDMPVFHNGAFHIISDCGRYFARPSSFYKPYIMSYNLKTGISKMLKLPREAVKGCHHNNMYCNMGIFNWGKASSSNRSICLVKLQKSVFTVWFLKSYKSRLWRKVLKMRVGAMGLKEENADVRGFMVMNGNLLVFATEEKVYSYGLDDDKFMILEEICQHSCGFDPHFISYSNTLRSCGINVETMPC